MAEIYSARGWEIPPLPWTNLSPPFSAEVVSTLRYSGSEVEMSFHRVPARWDCREICSSRAAQITKCMTSGRGAIPAAAGSISVLPTEGPRRRLHCPQGICLAARFAISRSRNLDVSPLTVRHACVLCLTGRDAQSSTTTACALPTCHASQIGSRWPFRIRRG